MKGLFVVYLSLALLAGSYTYGQSKWESVEWHEHIVQPGDNLWTIAEKSNISEDVRDIIAVMVDYNDTDGMLHAGQSIKYPVKKVN